MSAMERLSGAPPLGGTPTPYTQANQFGNQGPPGPPTVPALAGLESPPPGRGQKPLSFQPGRAAASAGPPPSRYGPPPTAGGGNAFAGGVQFGLPEGGNATFTLQLQNLEREVSELRETLAVEQRERERLTAKVHSDKGAVGENTMGTLTIAMRELQEAAKADRSVLYELEHHLSEERNARVTVEDDIDSHIERLEQQEKKSLRDVFEVKTEIEHVGTELTAMYAELTKLQQQVVTQLRGEYEDAVRTVDRKYSGLLAGSTGSSEALSLAQQALSRVARLEERVATSEDDHHDQLEELKMIIANQQTEFETRLTRMADETKGLLAAQERKHAQALAAVVAEQKDHSAAIHQCMDMLENEFASNAALQQTEERLAQALDRVGKAAEASHEALAEVGAGLAECNQAMLVVENSAADAAARAEQLGEERAVWERTAETAMDDMEAELQGKMATFESETHVFEDMVRRKLLDIVRLIPRPVNTF